MKDELSAIRQPENLLYDHATQLDSDPDFWFRMRGQSINPMVDAASPLLGMVMRVRQLTVYDQVTELYKKVKQEIEAIEQELTRRNYERPVILSFRYILCTFIDEAVMGQQWGGHSEWSANSLLAHFHSETWGGEKVFTLLSTLETEPQRYRDILEFIYLCLCMGFSGRYRVTAQGHSELMSVIRRLYHTLYPQPQTLPLAFHLDSDNQKSRYHLRRQIPLSGLFIVFCLILTGIFGIYHYWLDQQTQDVLQQLTELLRQKETG